MSIPKCDGSCPKRQVGCRTDCEIWKAEEARKEKRYAAKAKERDAAYTIPMVETAARRNVRAHKMGRRV